MKKIKMLLIVLFTGLVISGCNLDEVVNKGGSNDSDLYSNINLMILDPSGSMAIKQGKSITFTAYQESDVYEAKVDGVAKKYVDVSIARNADGFIVVDVTKLKDIKTKAGDIITLKAKIDGYLYATVESKNVDTLNLIGQSFAIKKADKKVKVDNSKYVDKEKNVVIKVTKIVKDVDSFGKPVANIYYSIENKSDNELSGQLNDYLKIEQAGKFLSTSSFDSVNDKPDNLVKFDTFTRVNPKITLDGFITVNLTDETSPVYVYHYNDNFDYIFDMELALQ